MRKEHICRIMKERWKFYLVGYAIGYAVPVIYDGILNIYYLLPIKMLAIYCAILIGTAFEGAYRSLKYVAVVAMFKGMERYYDGCLYEYY